MYNKREIGGVFRMKRKCVWIFLLIGVVVLMTGCEKKKTKKEETKNTTGYDLPVSQNEKKEAKADIIQRLKIKNSSFETGNKTIEGVLTATSSTSKKMNAFLLKVKEKKACELILYQREDDESVIRSKYTFDGKNMYLLYSRGIWNQDKKPVVANETKTRMESWSYTKKGWFIYKLCAPKSTEEVDTVSMIRVKPWNQKYLKLANEYMNPIGYKGNNLFLINWDSKNLKSLDYNGLYEFLYRVKHGKYWTYKEGTNHINAEKFENLMTTYLPVTKSQVRKYADYSETKRAYSWVELACGNYSPTAFGMSIPEITKVEKNKDGTTKLTIDAVCEMLGNDTLMTHEVTVRFGENGSVKYLGNKIIKGNDNIPEYKMRVGGES